MQRSALVTGASGGLGTAVVAAFREAGYIVKAVSRDGEIPADLTKEEGVREAIAAAGKVDILLHLLGAFAPGNDEDAWDRMIEMNVRAASRMFRAVLPPMREAKWGRVIAIGSKAGETRPAGLDAYVATKSALHALVQATAAGLSGSGVTANAILPSTIDTPGTRASMPKADFSKWVQPDEIAAMLLHLCTDSAAHMNGILIPMGD